MSCSIGSPVTSAFVLVVWLAVRKDPPDWFVEQRAVVGDGLAELRAVLLGEPARPTWRVMACWNDGKVRTMKLDVRTWNEAMKFVSGELGTEPPDWSGSRYIVSVNVRRERTN